MDVGGYDPKAVRPEAAPAGEGAGVSQRDWVEGKPTVNQTVSELFERIKKSRNHKEKVDLCKRAVQQQMEPQELKTFQKLWNSTICGDSGVCNDTKLVELFEAACSGPNKEIARVMLKEEKERSQLGKGEGDTKRAGLAGRFTKIAAESGNLDFVDTIFRGHSSFFERLFKPLSERAEVKDLLKENQLKLYEEAIRNKDHKMIEALNGLAAEDIDHSKDEELFLRALESKDPKIIEAVLTRVKMAVPKTHAVGEKYSPDQKDIILVANTFFFRLRQQRKSEDQILKDVRDFFENIKVIQDKAITDRDSWRFLLQYNEDKVTEIGKYLKESDEKLNLEKLLTSDKFRRRL